MEDALCIVQNAYCYPLPLPERRFFFFFFFSPLAVHYETLVGFLEVKSMEVCLKPQGISHSHTILYSASSNLLKLQFKYSCQFRALGASGKLISVVIYYIHLPLLISHGGFT